MSRKSLSIKTNEELNGELAGAMDGLLLKQVDELCARQPVYQHVGKYMC